MSVAALCSVADVCGHTTEIIPASLPSCAFTMRDASKMQMVFLYVKGSRGVVFIVCRCLSLQWICVCVAA